MSTERVVSEIIATSATNVMSSQGTRLCEMIAFYEAFLGTAKTAPADVDESSEARRIRYAATHVRDDLVQALVSLEASFNVLKQIADAHNEAAKAPGDQKEESDADD